MTEGAQRQPAAIDRRSFLGGGLAAAVGLVAGGGLQGSLLARAAALPRAEPQLEGTYLAIRELLRDSPLPADEAAAAAGDFRHWYSVVGEGMQQYVRQVFDALDAATPGSFRSAGRSARRQLLGSWLDPGASSLPESVAARNTALALGAQSIVAAPMADDPVRLAPSLTSRVRG
jgi:hypothetical protein